MSGVIRIRRTLAPAVGPTVALCALACLAACRDDTAPDAGVGFFRLESFNSMPLPYKSPRDPNGPLYTITRGELLIRPNGTFVLTVDGIELFLHGTYSRAGDEVRFTVPGGVVSVGPWTFSAPVAGDSADIVLSPPPTRLLYRRAAVPDASIRSATYVLTELNGRGAPLVWLDTVIAGTRNVGRVQFDSITLVDGVLYTGRRSEVSTAYLAGGDSIFNEYGGKSFGSFTATAGWLVLRRYSTPFPPYLVPSIDSLAIGPGTLTRSTSLGRITVERYSARR